MSAKVLRSGRKVDAMDPSPEMSPHQRVPIKSNEVEPKRTLSVREKQENKHVATVKVSVWTELFYSFFTFNFGKIFAAYYACIIHLFLWVDDEKMNPQVEKQYKAASTLDICNIGVDIIKPSREQQEEFSRHVLPIFIKKTLYATSVALFESLINGYKVECKENHIINLLNDTYYGRLIQKKAGQWVIDLHHHADLEMVKGFCANSVVANLKFSNDRFTMESVTINGYQIGRSHRNWETAKMFFLSTVDNETLFADHAVIHMYADYMEAAALKTLARHNPLRKFLNTHFGYSIALDQFITDILFKHNSPGNAFGLMASGIFDLMKKGFREMDEQLSDDLHPNFAPTNYFLMMKQSHKVIFEHVAYFCDNNLVEGNQDWKEIQNFFTMVHQQMKFVPSGDKINMNIVKLMITHFVYQVTFGSAGDHIVTESELGFYKTLFRIREKFNPQRTYNVKQLYRRIDTFQRVYFRTIFTQYDHVPIALIDAEYDPSIKVDTPKFREGLRNLQAEHPRLFDLKDVPSFITV